jgi:hypothetical protein
MIKTQINIPSDDKLTPILSEMSGIVTGSEVLRASPNLIPSLYSGPPIHTWAMNHAKGELTEALTERFMTEGFFERTGNWVPGTPASIGRTGIDGLLFKTDTKGYVRDMMVTETKYGSSKLGNTKDGVQMGTRWVQQRLHQTSEMYQRLYEAAENGISKGTFRGSKMSSNSVHVPLRNGEQAIVWKKNGKVYYYTKSQVQPNEVRTQIGRTKTYVQAAAEGRISIKTRIFRYKVDGNEHVFTLCDTKTGIEKTYRGKFENLPPRMQRLIKHEFEKLFSKGRSPEEARKLAEKACKDPDFFRSMNRDARWSWRQGFDVNTIRLAGGAFVITAAISALMDWQRGQRIDWEKALVTGTLGGTSAAAGYYVGTQIQSLLYATKAGQSILRSIPIRSLAGKSGTSLLGGVAGGAATQAIFLYGLYFLGYSDLKSANRCMIAGGLGTAGGAGAAATAMALVVANGSAGTGAAIAGLAGMAQTNAAMAVLGGGTIASGGGGMALGATVLSGGTAVVVIAVMAGTMVVFKKLDEKEQRTVLEGRLEITNKRVAEGRQVEWTHNSPPLCFDA